MGLAPEGGLVGPCPAGRVSVCRASVGSTPPSFGSRLVAGWCAWRVPWARLRIPGAVLDADERVAFEPLRRENAELRLDCQFLGKAAFFASEQDR